MIIITLIGFSLLCQVGALGLIFGYAKAIQVGSILEFQGIIIHVRESFGSLILVAASSFVMLLAYALFSFFQQREILLLRQVYRKYCMKRFISISSYLPHSASSVANSMVANQNFFILGEKEATACAKTLEQLLKISPKFIAILIFSAVIIYIDYKLSIIIAILSIIALLPLYIINIRIAHFGNRANLDNTSIETQRQGVKSHFKYSINPVQTESLDEKLQFLKYTDQYDLNDFFAAISNEMIVNIFTAFSLGVVIIYQGEKLLLGEFPWEQMIIFLTVLRALLAAMKSSLIGLSRISRDYGKLKSYHSLIVNTRGFDKHEKNYWNSQTLRPSSYVSGLDGYNMNGFHKKPIALLYTKNANKRFLFSISKAFIYQLESQSTQMSHPQIKDIWASFKRRVGQETIREVFNIPDEIDTDHFQKLMLDIHAKTQLENNLFLEEVTHIDLNETLSFSPLNRLSNTTYNLLLLAASTFSDRKLVVLPHTEGLETLVNRFKEVDRSEKIYFILYKKHQDLNMDHCFIFNDYEDIRLVKVEDLRKDPNRFLTPKFIGSESLFETQEDSYMD